MAAKKMEILYKMLTSRNRFSGLKKVCVVLMTAIMMFSLMGCELFEPFEAAPPEIVTPEPEPLPEPAAPVQTYVFPLTGKETTNPSLITKRPIVVKIENSPQAYPQKGLGSADVVYETVIEGGETRFACIFQSKIPPECEPIRSARNSDTSIVPQYRGILFYSGSNTEVDAAMRRVGMDFIQDGTVDFLFKRDQTRYSPHNLVLDTEKIYEVALDDGCEIEVADYVGLSFGPSVHAVTEPATHINIPFSHECVSDWDWNPEDKVYYKEDRGRPHFDGATEEQISAANVVVMWADYSQAAMLDPAGSPTYNVSLNGTGRAAVFKSGIRINGTWNSDGASPPRFYDEDGVEITLNTGQTWFQVPWAHIEITSAASDGMVPEGEGEENYEE